MVDRREPAPPSGRRLPDALQAGFGGLRNLGEDDPLGGADLAPGSEYVLFLAHADLPGAANRLTIRDQSQGVFEIVRGRAFSQAIGEPLLPDAHGMIDVPGGDDGLALDELIGQVHSNSER